jgi:hypothetical protein
LVFTRTGPVYRNLETVASSALRRVRNIYYDQGFAEIIYREIILHHAKATRFYHKRMKTHQWRCTCDAAPLFARSRGLVSC